MIDIRDKLLLIEERDLPQLAEHLFDLLTARQFSTTPPLDLKYLTPAKLAKVIGYSEDKIRKAIQAGKYGKVDTSSARPRLYATVTESRNYHFAESNTTRNVTGQKKDLYR